MNYVVEGTLAVRGCVVVTDDNGIVKRYEGDCE